MKLFEMTSKILLLCAGISTTECILVHMLTANVGYFNANAHYGDPNMQEQSHMENG